MDVALVVRFCRLWHLSGLGCSLGLLHHRSRHPIRRRENKEMVNFAAHRPHLVYYSSATGQSEERFRRVPSYVMSIVDSLHGRLLRVFHATFRQRQAGI